MQDLRALLESAEEHRTALKSGAAPPPAPPPRQHVKFFVVPEGDEHQELREISALWRSPSQRHAAADLWSHSAESVLTALLRQVEPLAPPAADDDEPAEPREDSALRMTRLLPPGLSR